MIVTRIGPLSLAKITAAIYAAIGLLMGAMFALLSFFGAAIGAASAGQGEPWFGALFGVGALIAAPIFYGLFGFLGGLFTALVYNVVAGAVGGVELHVDR